jgi:hypothetical protein
LQVNYRVNVSVDIPRATTEKLEGGDDKNKNSPRNDFLPTGVSGDAESPIPSEPLANCVRAQSQASRPAGQGNIVKHFTIFAWLIVEISYGRIGANDNDTGVRQFKRHTINKKIT